MSWLEWGLQLLLLALLGAAIPFALRLERALREIRRDRAAMEGSAQGLGEAARMAEAAMVRLRASAEVAGRQVAEKLATAEPLRDDLRYLIERAETLADRLEELVRSGRPLAQDAPRVAEPAPLQSQAERDLLRAITLGARGMR
jgi:chemotaxis regulatin CheY-phosphate phosphatase CheZ